MSWAADGEADGHLVRVRLYVFVPGPGARVHPQLGAHVQSQARMLGVGATTMDHRWGLLVDLAEVTADEVRVIARRLEASGYRVGYCVSTD